MAAAAYAALLSLSHILHQIRNPPPTFDFKLPTEGVESLRAIVSSLIEFLETYPSRRSQEIENLEERIVGAVCEAEDLVESYVVRRILMKYAARPRMKSFALFCRSIQMNIGELLKIQKASKKIAILKVNEGFTSIRREVDKFKSTKGVQDASPVSSLTSSSSTSLPGGKNMVGFVEDLDRIRSIVASDDLKLLIVPIVGMGGIGKSTLALNAYADLYIIERFDVRAWVSVSQEYKEREIVIALLQQVNSKIDGDGLSVDELGVLLYKELFGRRYLIVLDDMWEIRVMERLQVFLPDNSTNSRILVTTRLGDLARVIGSCNTHEMSLLDKDKSWDLIHEYVKEDYPIELKEIGKSIARGCRGLPLALVVIGGLLAQSEKTRDFWLYVEENVSSTVSNANDEHCLKVLRLSYNHLPVHLKPCFLYLAVFPKNFEIRVSRVIRLWVAEGFIKPREGKSLEEVAQGYVKDLVDRNLVMISKRGQSGMLKNCIIHDFIRELCVLEAQKNKFLCIAKVDNPSTSQQLESARRLSIHTSTEALRLGTHNRSILSYSAWESRKHVSRRLNLLRVMDSLDSYSMDEIMLLFNSRYIACAIPRDFHLSSSMSLLWNLQTLVFSGPISLPHDFWQMPQLRHLKIPGITLANPLHGDENIVVLKNLQTLTTIRNFIFSKNVVRRIPNLKKLGIDCDTTEGIRSFCLHNLASSLDKLETLVLKCSGSWEIMAFPISLKKLTLSHCQIPWEDMSVVGSLPNLEVLKLMNRAAKGGKWSPNEGEFLRLKFLLIDWCQLETWEAVGSHFPSLEHLQLVGVRLEEFPVAFAEILTLRTVDLNYCSGALSESANNMSRDREDFGFDNIQIRSFPSQASRSKINYMVVGMEDEAEKLIGYLSAESQVLDVISIVGPGGLGKTTLAGKIFRDPAIQIEYPLRLWITLSRVSNEKTVLLSILKEITSITEVTRQKTKEELAELISHYLENVKFLLVVDDVWTTEEWDRVQYALPRNNKRGKVLITSQAEQVCQHVNLRRAPCMLRFLTREESFELLQLEVFGDSGFPSEMEDEGRLIADQCRGLPLAILLVGGILAKQLSASNEMSTFKAALKETSETFNANLGFDSLVVRLSYERLPHYLKKCFLYLGMFPRDFEIPTWKLIRMWISEGFIPQEDNIYMEETAEKYVNDLISFNLLRAERFYANGKVRTCRIHEILRDICIRKAVEETDIFLQEVRTSHSEGLTPLVFKEHKYQRICIHSNVLNFLSEKPYCPSVQSFVCFSEEEFLVPPEYISVISAGFKSLSVLDVMPFRFSVPPSDMYQLTHLRYLALFLHSSVLPAAFSKFRNIQTLIVQTDSRTLDVKAGIMDMIELRHFKTNAATILPKPNESSEGGENIQTLGTISPESCSEDVFDRARNLKKLSIRGRLLSLLEGKKGSFSSLQKLENLEKLTLLNDVFPLPQSEGKLLGLPPADTFPIKLRSLTLSDTRLDWTQMSILGSLENLEVLKLKDKAFLGETWEASDGGFPHLQVLHIGRTDMRIWVASHRHFPRLKILVLKNCEVLEAVPAELADIPNLRQLDMYRCTRAVASARKIEARKRAAAAHPFRLTVSYWSMIRLSSSHIGWWQEECFGR